MATDLDQLIQDADPARNLIVSPPDPAAARARYIHRQPRRKTPSIGAALGAGLAVAVTVAVALIAFTVGGHRISGLSSGRPKPRTGVVLKPTPGPVLARAADPHGGLPWGIELLKVDGQPCVQVGRLDPRRGLGAIGKYGAYHNDGRFHAILAPGLSGIRRPCTQPDANGNVFYNTLAQVVPGSAIPQDRPCGAASEPANQTECSPRDLRTLAYGLLGPDAISITYRRSAAGKPITKPTGRGGAYLIVLPADQPICIAGGSLCKSDPKQITSMSVPSGVIAAVTYRDGHVCHLPARVGFAACFAHGYVAPAANQVAATASLAGDGIAAVKFGAPPAAVTAAVQRLLGSSSSPYKSGGACNYDHTIQWPELSANFKRSRFVGYSYGMYGSLGPPHPPRHRLSLTTTKGLQIGDTLIRGQQLYGQAFKISGANGGTWGVHTPGGEIDGFNWNAKHSSDASPRSVVATIEAGAVGCPAQSPSASTTRLSRRR